MLWCNLPPLKGCLRVTLWRRNGREWLVLVGTHHRLLRVTIPYRMRGEQEWYPRAANEAPASVRFARHCGA